MNTSFKAGPPPEYLSEPEQWSPQWAKRRAEAEGIRLSEDSWAVLGLLREQHQDQGEAPSFLSLVIAFSKLKDISRKEAKQTLYRLFPKGPRDQALRIAGLPKPKYGCL